MDFVASAALKCADDILGGRLEESDDVGDKFLLALDGDERLEIVGSVDRRLDVSTLKDRLLVGSSELLYELSGSVAYVGEHDGSIATEARVELSELTVNRADCLLDQRILNDLELNLLLEAGLAESASLLGVEALDVDEVEVVVALNRLSELFEESGFIFFSHDS